MRVDVKAWLVAAVVLAVGCGELDAAGPDEAGEDTAVTLQDEGEGPGCVALERAEAEPAEEAAEVNHVEAEQAAAVPADEGAPMSQEAGSNAP